MADERRARIGQIAVEAIPQAIGTIVGGLFLLALGAAFGVLRNLDRAETTALVISAVAGLVALAAVAFATRAAREEADAARLAYLDAMLSVMTRGASDAPTSNDEEDNETGT
jgi:hypothetical protein